MLNKYKSIITGSIIALTPIATFSWIILSYFLFIPEPINPPNQTLRGTEVIFPILLGVFLALTFKFIAFKKTSKKIVTVWIGFALLPLIISLIFIWIIFPLIG